MSLLGSNATLLVESAIETDEMSSFIDLYYQRDGEKFRYAEKQLLIQYNFL